MLSFDYVCGNKTENEFEVKYAAPTLGEIDIQINDYIIERNDEGDLWYLENANNLPTELNQDFTNEIELRAAIWLYHNKKPITQ